jgi:hypothetical protein
VALWIATVSAIVSAVDYSRRINVIMAAKPAPAEPVDRDVTAAPADKDAAPNRVSA